MDRVNVIDSVMGSGKSTYIIDFMNQAHQEDLSKVFSQEDFEPRRFLYIAITLKEADRIRLACPDMDFVDPKPVSGSKLTHFHDLIEQGKNITSTHSLFSLVDQRTINALRHRNYTLVIDEVLDTVTDYQDVTADDIKNLFGYEFIKADEAGRVSWRHDLWNSYNGVYNRIRDLCDNGNLCWLRGSMLVWELPTKFLELFQDVWVCTYLFEGSLMCNYLRANKVEYRKFSIASGRTTDKPHLVGHGMVSEKDIKARLRRLITIVDDRKLNAVGTKRPGVAGTPLSSTWFDTHLSVKGGEIERLRKNTYTFFRRHAETTSSMNLWTTFGKAQERLTGDGYSRGFLRWNAKATNWWRKRASVAYLVNVYLRPSIKSYFEDNGIEADETLFALSEMIQFVWRSRIREGHPICLYIPSERMRNLFIAWLHADSVVELKEAA